MNTIFAWRRGRRERRSHARFGGGFVRVEATSNFAPSAIMTCSIDGYTFESPMTFESGRYVFVGASPVNLRGRRVLVSTDEGGAYNSFIR